MSLVRSLPSLAVLCLAWSVLPACGETFLLRHQTRGRGMDFLLPVGDTEIRFTREPAYIGDHIVRGALFVAPGKDAYIAFACDLDAGKLYVDKNRNLDLTDDPDGIFEATDQKWGRTFTNITLSIASPGPKRNLLLDLRIYGFGAHEIYTVKTHWTSDAVTIGGKTYEVTIYDNGDGVITTNDILVLRRGKGHRADDILAPSSIILSRNLYALSYEISHDGETLALTITPGQEELVDVEITGGQIERLILQGGDKAAIFIHPKSPICLLPGIYNAHVYVRGKQERQSSLWHSDNASLSVEREAEQKAWALGGPITSRLSCHWQGHNLVFNHAFFGIGGEKYKPIRSKASFDRPKLHIIRNGQTLHVGQFEYG